MKRLIILLLCLGSSLSFGQNLVPNPSFENMTQCPFSFGLEAYTSDWKSARETPDYFHSCVSWTGWEPSVPTNGYGYQEPYFSGNAYLGMLTYRSDSSIYTEAASVQLTSPLTIGATYYVSFKVSLTLESSSGSLAANNKIGVQFSNVDYYPSNPAPINNFAHVWTDSIITDTLNWTTVKGSFTADSAYSFLNLGNFFDKQNMDSIIYGSAFGAYYYFDDICVSADSNTCYSSVGLYELDKTKFSIYPNPVVSQFNIKNTEGSEIYNVSIFNSVGKLLYTNQMLSGTTTINCEQFGDGLLNIRIESDNTVLNYKLLKQSL